MDSFISLNGLSPELMNTASTASIVWTSGSPTKSEQYTSFSSQKSYQNGKLCTSVQFNRVHQNRNSVGRSRHGSPLSKQNWSSFWGLPWRLALKSPSRTGSISAYTALLPSAAAEPASPLDSKSSICVSAGTAAAPAPVAGAIHQILNLNRDIHLHPLRGHRSKNGTPSVTNPRIAVAQAPRSSSRASGLPSQGADRENVAAGRLRRPGSQERGAGDAGGAEGDVGRGAGEELAPADQQGPVLEPRHHLLLLLPRRRRDGAEVIGC